MRRVISASKRRRARTAPVMMPAICAVVKEVDGGSEGSGVVVEEGVVVPDVLVRVVMVEGDPVVVAVEEAGFEDVDETPELDGRSSVASLVGREKVVKAVV
jgi:hypothetical protein